MWDYIAGDATMKALVDLRVYNAVSPGFATGLLNVTALPSNGQTVVIANKTYTWKNSVTGGNDVDGFVNIGSDVDDSLDNLVAAINLASGAGTAYASKTTEHGTVTASRPLTGSLEVMAKRYSHSDDLGTTETMADGAWYHATMNIFPYVATSLISTRHERTMDGGAGIAFSTLNIECVSDNSPDSEDVADAVFALVQGKDATTIGTPAVTIESMTAEEDNDGYEPPENKDDVGLHGRRMKVTIWHRETIPSP